MAFEKDVTDGGVEIKFRCTEQDYEILKYAGNWGYSNGSFDPTTVIRQLLRWEMMTLEMQSGEIEKFRWKLLLQGKDPNVDLRQTNPELDVKSGGIIRDKKTPSFKPRLPGMLTYESKN